jgi:hypothetical protein
MMRVLSASVMLFVTAVPMTAQAQPGRSFVALNAGVQAGRSALDDRFDFDQDQEKATVDVDYPAKAGMMVDAGGGLRVWRNLGIGVAVTYFTTKSTARVEARIPHPFHFDRFRDVSGDRSGAERRETAVHVQARYPLALGRRLELVVAAGPSFFNTEQELVTGVQFDQTFPFDEATFRAADARRASGSAVGFNAGADVVWPLGRRLGVGGAIRFVRGAVDLDAANGRRVAVDAGGLQAALGLRLFL